MMPMSDPSRRVDNDHLNTLSILHYVLAALNLFGGVMAIVQFTFFGPFMERFFKAFEQEAAAKGNKGPLGPLEFNEMMHLMMSAMLVFAIVFAGVGLLNVISGYFLKQRRHRTFSIVIAAIDCLYVPLGTLLGAFTIIVLSRDTVRAIYEEHAGAAMNPYSSDSFR